ncbi:MAG TPA: prepilin-type N-terminal cleavage/methylation domain-containing protein [Turneriella sp.]|nr:prepilin-type N-terminal cleavage/methylation domain-containing protein [Turneriella sp.]
MRARRGFTLIELLVVLVIGGSLLVLAYNLLASFMHERLSGNQDMAFEGYFQDARRQALIQAKTLTLEVNFDKRTFGLREYDPKLELAPDAALKELAEIKRYRYEREKDREFEEMSGKEKPQPKWIYSEQKLPTVLKKILSSSGLELAGPMVWIHFYPTGNSDSVILQFGETAPNFVYIPRYNLSVVHLSEIRAFERQQEAPQ